MSEFAVEYELLGNIDKAALVIVRGAVDAKATGYRETLMKLQADGVIRFVLDLKDVTFMNSTALGFLVNLNDQIDEAQGGIWVANLPSKVKTVFDMMGLSEMFYLVPTRTAGIDSVVNRFSAKPPPLPYTPPPVPPAAPRPAPGAAGTPPPGGTRNPAGPPKPGQAPPPRKGN